MEKLSIGARCKRMRVQKPRCFLSLVFTYSYINAWSKQFKKIVRLSEKKISILFRSINSFWNFITLLHLNTFCIGLVSIFINQKHHIVKRKNNHNNLTDSDPRVMVRRRTIPEDEDDQGHSHGRS